MPEENDDEEEDKAFKARSINNKEKATYGYSKHDLEALGERVVRYNLNCGDYAYPGDKTHAFVSAWLADMAYTKSLEDSLRRDACEAKALSISMDSNALAERALSISIESNRLAKEDLSAARSSAASARSQATWARWAATIAMVAAIIDTRDQISRLIEWLQ